MRPTEAQLVEVRAARALLILSSPEKYTASEVEWAQAQGAAPEQIASPTVRAALEATLLLLVLVVALLGCSTARDTAVLTLAQAAEFGTDAQHGLELLDRADQEDAIAHAPDPHAAVLAVRRKYSAAWQGYRRFRAAWIAAAGTVRIYDDADRLRLAHSEGDFTKALADLLEAERELVKATTALRSAP